MFFEPFGHVEDINLRILNLKLECFCSGHFTLCGNSSELSLFILSKWMVMVTKKNCNTQNKLGTLSMDTLSKKRYRFTYVSERAKPEEKKRFEILLKIHIVKGYFYSVCY